MYDDNYNYNYYNDDFSNNNFPVEEKKPKTKRNIMKFLSLIALFLIVIVVVITFLAFFKVIKLPWINYPEALKLSQSEIVLRENDNYQLSSEVFPSNIPYGKLIYLSSDPDVVEVNQVTGYITAKKNGIATVTAKLDEYGDILDTCNVVVSNNAVYISNIIIKNENINMVVGKEQSLEYSFEPNNASVHNFIFESSNEEVAKVDNNGLIKAVDIGTAIITITDKSSNVSAMQTINVYENQAIEEVVVSHKSVNLVVDGTIQLTASVKPDSANQKITWSSVDENIASVTTNGLVRGVNYGTTKIIATAIDGTNAVIDVKVQEKSVKVESIIINQKDFFIDVGDTKKLSVTIKPSNATNQGVIWTSSAPNIVAINSNGDVKGINYGVAKVTAKTSDGGYTSSINITVIETNKETVKETDIKLSYNKKIINIGKSLHVKAEVIPQNSTNKALIWTSSNTNVATVSNGTIYGKSEGSVVIKVSSKNGITKSISIIVTAIPVSGIKLSDSKRKINIGEQYPLVATISPSDASYKKVTWTSSDSTILSVDEKGLVTPHKVGKATITATTYNGKKATCIFTITNEAIMPTGIKISKSQIEVKEKGKVGLTAVVQPSNATNQKVTWKIENSNLATINDQGIITGVSDGITRVTATTVNGKSTSAFVVIKSNNNTKYNYLNGTTIKYWIENNTSKNAYITHIWVKDAYNQFATMLPAKFPGLATAPTLMKRVASKYPNKAAVGVNASGFVSYNYKTNSGFGAPYAKANSKWNYSPVIPIVISDGKVMRDFTNAKMPNTDNTTYGLNKKSLFTYYWFSKDVKGNAKTVEKLKSAGVKNTFGFRPVLCASKSVRPNLTNNKDIRQAICQIDKNNFIIYTNISNDRTKGFGFKDLANLMVSDKCTMGFNLDGGGSTNLLYKKKTSKNVIGVRTTTRAVADIIYFYGD